MTNSNAPLPRIDERIVPKPQASSSNNKTVIIVISVFFTFLLMLLIVGFFVYYFFFNNIVVDPPVNLYQACLSAPNSPGCSDCVENGEDGEICNKCENLHMSVANEQPLSGSEEEYFKRYCSQSTVSTDLFQTCLSMPDSKGCEDCKYNGSNGTICKKCEELYSDNSKGLSMDIQDQEYFKENCSFSEVSPITGDETITLFDTSWASFNYSLPSGGTISGIAPISHAFGTDFGTNSLLGNSIDFSFESYDDQSMTSVQISLVYSEGVYSYYKDSPEIVDSTRGLYRFWRPTTKSITYTDSYEKDKCEEYVSSYISEPTLAGVCGTEMLFDHSYIATCKYEGDIDNATVMCDEFFKNLSIK